MPFLTVTRACKSPDRRRWVLHPAAIGGVDPPHPVRNRAPSTTMAPARFTHPAYTSHSPGAPAGAALSRRPLDGDESHIRVRAGRSVHFVQRGLTNEYEYGHVGRWV